MKDLFDVETQLSQLKEHREQHDHIQDYPTLPTAASIQAAEASLPSPQSANFLSESTDEQDVARHITRDILPALNGQGRSSRYYGFVTGGVLPVAQWADNIVTHMDQNVQVHLPNQTVATTIEDRALEMLIALLGLGGTDWPRRTLTTGATGSNVLGLACGREAVLAKRLGSDQAAGELGILGACVQAGIKEIQILTSAGHSSLSKAASVVGLGRQSVKELRLSEAEPWRLDLDALEEYLKKPGIASIIALSSGEVNTGRYSLNGIEEMQRVRALADKYDAWIHVDGAFGIFARVLEQNEDYKLLHERVAGIELADSITVDGHKVLNVPYDCGMFFTRSLTTLQNVFVNPNAAYLSAGSTTPSIASPLNVGLENSRRFRALPAYAALLSEGRPGFARLVANMVQLSRRLAAFLRDCPHYELLPNADLDEVFIIVLFRAKAPELNARLVEEINKTRQMYVSGTSWKGEKAVRVAVSNWKVDVERDYRIVTAILTAVAEGKAFDISTVE